MTGLDSTAVPDGVSAQQSAGTPSPFREAAFSAQEALEFAGVLSVVAGFAAGPLGAERIHRRRPSAEAEWVRAELAPLAELLPLYARGDSVDVLPVPPLELVLRRLRLEGSVLEGPELVAIRQTLSAARAAQAELRRIARDASSTASLVVPLPNRGLEQRLARALDDAGEVLDSASPGLLRARREVQESRERLIEKLESLLHGLDPRARDAGAEVTMRNGRYVIPVRRDSRVRMDGIVHDESASGGTLFIEPAGAIELGNALRAAVAEAEREVLRVLRELTQRFRPLADQIDAAHASCVALDDLVARVRYAHSVGGAVPALRAPGGSLVLRGARHPLLLARGIEAVPFDLELDAGQQALLISGPNAGGKTVLLKTVGLVAALVQSGIVPPLEPGSVVPIFERIVADIGDHQSIAADLSTFTAHVIVLRGLLAEADRGTLVLVDEIGGGTDPAEGGALAAAALRALTRHGALTIATTHLGALKALATQTEGIVNGSLQFDSERLAPTFRFTKGIPGRSYGLAIARRLGVAAEVMADAERRISRSEHSLDALLQAAEARERRLATAEAELQARLGEVEREAARLRREAEIQRGREGELRAREKNAERQARLEARRLLLDARDRVEGALREAWSAQTEAAATEARRRLETAIREQGDALSALEQEGIGRTGEGGAEPRVATGQRVRLGSGGIGWVVEVRADGNAVVAAGNVRVVVPVGSLMLVPEVAREPGSWGGRRKTGPAPRPDAESRSPPEIDLRGMRADEAEAATVSALDTAILADQPFLRIIHGMGTGTVRQVVRRVLAADRRVAKFEFAPGNQGGSGVTVAEFAE